MYTYESFLKNQVNWNIDCNVSADNPVDDLNKHLSMLVGRYLSIKVIRGHNQDMPWFDDQCRRAFGLKQEAHRRWIRNWTRVNWDFLSAVN